MITKSSFFSFETAKRAMTNAQLGLDTVGHNMTNINSPGYTRQRVDQVSVAVSGNSKYTLNKGFFPGMGAKAIGISQMRDPFLDARYRTEAAGYGELVVKNSGYIDLEKIFDETLMDSGLAEGLADVIAKFEDALKKADDPTYASQIQGSIKVFSKILNDYNTKLDSMRTQQMSDLEKSVELEVNVILEKIADLNEQIAKVEVYGNPGNELRDERNYLLDQLAGFVDIKVEETPKKITPDVTVNYMKITIKGTDTILVDRDQFGSFEFSKDAATGMYAELKLNDAYGVQKNETDTDDILQTGALRGYLDIINGSGSYSQPPTSLTDNTSNGIAYAQGYLDSLARKFAEVINQVNIGNGGSSIIHNTDDDTDGTTTTPITAGNIGLSLAFNADPTKVILNNPSNTSSNPPETMRFIDALKHSKYSDVCSDLANTTLVDVIDGFAGKIASEKNRSDNLFSNATKAISTIDDLRQSISGVSENEEAINMMTYSNYYNAAIRYMTTLDEALDKVINGMGIVGR